MVGNNSTFIGLATIVKELRSLREQCATGTYYIVSSDNRQVRLGLSAGEVNAISLRAQNLSSALDALASQRITRTRFAKDGLVVARGDFGFSTDELIHGLLSRSGQSAPAVQEASAKSVPAGAYLSQGRHAVLRRLSIEYLGPIGEFVYDECREIAGTPKDLLAALAQEIPDKRNAARFLVQARSALYGPG